jgi:hypothetical protein
VWSHEKGENLLHEIMAIMTEERWQDVWLAQCHAARDIRERFGVQAAFDYIVAEKLLNYVDAAATRAEFARELPRFVAEVREIFVHGDIASEIARLRKDLNKRAADSEDDPDEDVLDDAKSLRRRLEQLEDLREMLIAPRLGPS